MIQSAGFTVWFTTDSSVRRAYFASSRQGVTSRYRRPPSGDDDDATVDASTVDPLRGAADCFDSIATAELISKTSVESTLPYVGGGRGIGTWPV
jgi:hypothetical protein